MLIYMMKRILQFISCTFASIFFVMREKKIDMLTEKFFEVIRNEGVVSIVSWGNAEPHLTCA